MAGGRFKNRTINHGRITESFRAGRSPGVVTVQSSCTDDADSGHEAGDLDGGAV